MAVVDIAGYSVQPGDVCLYIHSGSGAIYAERVLCVELDINGDKGTFQDGAWNGGAWVQTEYDHQHKFTGRRLVRLQERVDVTKRCVLCSGYGHTQPPCP